MRSLRCVPGDYERKLARAAACGADSLILDLEDSVAPAMKAAARRRVAAYLDARGDRLPAPDSRAPAPDTRSPAPEARAQICYVRVNSFDSPHHADDVAAMAGARPDGLMLPKSEPEQVRRLCANLKSLENEHHLPEGGIKILAIATETARAVFTLGSYAGTSSRLAGLACGEEDLATALGMLNRNDVGGIFGVVRALCVLGAAAAGVPAFDGVYVDFRDAAGLRAECLRARSQGFGGKLAIHPDQVPVINDAFRPTARECDWAARVAAAFRGNEDLGALSIDGRMVDRVHLTLAERILARSGAYGTTQGE